MSIVQNLTRLLEWIYPICLRKVTEGSLTQLNSMGESFYIKLIQFLWNFWACFLFHLPDLTPLMDIFVCLNLSFNNLLFFPVHVCAAYFPWLHWNDVKLKFYSLVIDLDTKLLPGQRLSLDNRVVDAGWKGVLAKPYSEQHLFRLSDVSLGSTGLLT